MITPDGAVHELDPATIAEGSAETSQDVYGDRKVLRAPLPALKVGAIVETEVTVRESRLDFDAGRVFFFDPGGADPVRRARLIIEAPLSIPVKHTARLLPSLQVRREVAGGTARFTFDCGSLGPIDEAEPDLPPEIEPWPRVAFSTGRSWKEVAARYAAIVEPQIAGSDLKEAAAAAFGGSRERGEVIRRALAWLHSEVRYTSVALGDASIVPRRPEEVLKRKYGDCKDQATLLVALLREAGIAASAALLQMGPDPDIDLDLPGFSWFDHVILFIPGTPETWIDPTEEFARPGELPPEDQGRLALVAAPDTEVPRKTPEAGPGESAIVEDREITIPEIGPARVVETAEVRGAFELEFRAYHHETERKTIEEDLAKYLRRTYGAKTLDRWEATDPTDLSRPFRLRLEGSGAENGSSDGAGAVVSIRISKITERLCSLITGRGEEKDEGEESGDEDKVEEEPAPKKRANDFLHHPPHILIWRYRISPPAGFSPEKLPPNEEAALGPARLSRKYGLLQVGAVEATFTFDTVKRRLSPDEYEALRAGVRSLRKADPVKIRFRSAGEKYLEAGRIKEALAEFRRLRELQPGGGAEKPGVFDVRAHGAAGDGKTLDTDAINRAIEACAAAGGGQVLLPPGRYLSGTILLKSNLTLKLDAGARLIGTPDLDRYRSFAAPEGTPEARFRGQWHRALILGVGVEDVAIVGPGTIDGNKVFDPQGEEKMRGPHTIILGNSRNVTIRDLDIADSANYAIMIEFSSQVEVRGVKVTGGWDGVHFRGWRDRPCRDLSILGCQFFTGDDSIAGRYAENLLISDCVVNSSCNGIRIIGPVEKMIVHDCLFYGPGVHPHRTQSRHNMLSGIILQPGAWDACEGALRDVLISDVTMKDVASPVTIFLKRPGNSAEGIVVTRLTATGVYRAAASVESWTETPVGRVVFRDASFEYSGGGAAEEGGKPARPPGVDSRPLPAWGLYARNAKELVLEDVRIGCAEKDLRPAMIAENVERLRMDVFRFPRFEGVAEPIVLKDVGQLERDGGDRK